MASVLAAKPKKKSKVDPLALETELNELGEPPSTSDLGELFGSERPESSMVAYTEDTQLDDSRANSQARTPKEGDDTSSRSSTPSSAGGLMKRVKRNVVTPIHEETSFGVDNTTYANDDYPSKAIPEAWSEAGSDVGSRPSTAPLIENQINSLDSRPQTAPQNSPTLLNKKNKITPVSSRTSTPLEKFIDEESTVKKDSISIENQESEETIVDKGKENASPRTSQSRKSVESRKEKLSTPMSAKRGAWSIEEENSNEEKIDAPEKSLVEKDKEDSLSVVSAEAVLAPPQASGEHQAYIPIDYAKECIQKVIEDMKKMKANHYKVVEKIQEQYQLIEEESQAQFNAYVIKLRGEYNTKAATFRHVIESHQTEFTNKQNFYEEAIKSLRDKNRSLLLEKRQFLLKAKDTNAKNEEEKNQILTDLTSMLDQKHKEYLMVRDRYGEEKAAKEETQNENTDIKNKLNEMQFHLEMNSGESEKIFEELKLLKTENEELRTEKQNMIDETSKLEEEHNTEKSKLKEEHSEQNKVIEEKEKTLDEKQKELEEKNKTIEELELNIKELESRPTVAEVVAPVTASAETVQATTEVLLQSNDQDQQIVPIPMPVSVANEELSDFQKKIHEQEELIKNLKNDIEESEKKNKNEEAKVENDIKEMRNEKNIAKMELINAQEKNAILHQRLETMLNEVMDSVDNSQIQVKLTELEGKKALLQGDIDEVNQKIEEWKENYRNEHDREEPTDDGRPDDIKELYDGLKAKKENMNAVDKDITVLSMLVNGTLPDDMKQEDHAENPVDKATEELRKQFEEEKEKLNDEIRNLKEENDDLLNQISELKLKVEELESREPEKIVETVTVSAASEGDETVSAVLPVASSNSEELTQALAEAEARLQELESEHATEVEAQKKQVHKLEKKLNRLQTSTEKLEGEKRDLESQLKVAKESAEAELKAKQESLDQAKKEIEELNEAKLSKLPVKAKTEIKALQEKLKQAEDKKDGSGQEILDLKSQVSSLNEQVANLNVTIIGLQEKEAELQKLKDIDKKYKELKKKYKALEAKKTVTRTVTQPAAASGGGDPEQLKKLQKKISELEKQIQDGEGKESSKPTAAVAAKKDSKTDPKAVLKLEKSNEMLKEKVENMKQTAQADAEKIKDLGQKLKEAKAKGDDKIAKKQEKAMKDLQKKLESEQKKSAKYKEDLDKEKEELANLRKELDALQAENKRDKDEIAKLGVAAKEGLEAAEKVTELSKSNKSLTEENKTLAENFNSERILRKKYYNMVEDMKGKIRVYARARPLSRSELDRGNHNIVTSPDEYSCIIQTGRGPKDFQYDAVFTPGHSQEKVFEDTNNLIQSAVDGYNVCIFAYGQTGSGKTYTMIGDKEQKSPGIAPRAFKAIYDLINENKSKFSFTTQMYMLELYRDNLIDLFGNTKDLAKLDIKKDKKGMVVVSGAVVKEATNSDELMEIFEKGSSNRHVASTKMNSESSRSHLVLSIVIESTNLTSGTVVKGKLSLVDLAGSERAAKTGATPEQLKEAQSINKSLSALGDVISALSSEQSFIPYRNNKLTMLMQDSLGGNAKTLMFVNISPADYNCDETITSLTYASRVKLITNDASKNSDNKEISRLKGIISKLKKGESVADDDD